MSDAIPSPDVPTEADVAAAHATLFAAGLVHRKSVLGNEYVDASLSRNAGTDGEDLQKYVSEFVWGSVWTRPGLDRRSRSLLNLGMLIKSGQEHELSIHVKGALNNGLSRTEIVEAVVHCTAYCGAPAGLLAMRVTQEVLERELGPLDAETDA